MFGRTSQTELSAKRDLRSAFGVDYPDAPFTILPCTVHGGRHCLGGADAEFHHLDESGENSAPGWFWENLVPICGGLNRAIQHARRPDLRKELITNHNELKLTALENRYIDYQIRGNLLPAYACARLGSFLAASADARQDSLRFAANSIWTLRGVEPKLSVPLATDTLSRSVIDYLYIHEKPPERSIIDLAAAVGSFHREFGDVGPARDYYEIALSLADRLNLDWPDADLLTLVRNIRVFLGGTSNIISSNGLVDLIRDRTGYPHTLHERLHIQQWNYRQHSRDTPARRRRASERFLAEIETIGQDYFDRKLVPGGSLTKEDSKPRAGIIVSMWDHAETLCLIGDAYSAQGEGDPHGKWSKLAHDAMDKAAVAQRKGHFAVAGLAIPRVFDTLFRAYDDRSFAFQFREPNMLARQCWRTAGVGPFRFSVLSKRLLEKMKWSIGTDRKIVRPSIRQIHAILGKAHVTHP